MFFVKEKNKRLRWVQIVSFALLIILGLRLAMLTLAQGEKYRNLADSRRVREVYLSAPRGEIRDRNGQLLAGNKPVFTLQLRKDEMDQQEYEEINGKLVQLLRLLERDGVSYLDEFPIVLNVIRFSDVNRALKSQSTADEVVGRLIESNLIGQFLMTSYVDEDQPLTYQYMTMNRAINALNVRGEDVPIIVSRGSSGLDVRFDSSKNSLKWKESQGLAPELPPLDSLVQLVGKDRTILKKILDHPLSRKLAFEVLEKNGKAAGLELVEFGNRYEEDYRNKKLALQKDYPGITMETSPQEDFCIIFRREGLRDFLTGPFMTDADGKVIDAAAFYMEALASEEIAIPVEYELARDTLLPEYSYIAGKEVPDVQPIDWLINQSRDLDVLLAMSEMPSGAGLMQGFLINKGVYPGISIAKGFEYTAREDERLWRTKYNIPEEAGSKEIFDLLLKKYDLDGPYNTYEKRGVLNLYYAADTQGYNAYVPLNFAYGLKDRTVANIEEQLADVKGLEVTVEPIRYYPYGTTASHVLGYLGKISQPYELEKYKEDKKYSLDDMIGKTGVEESFESYLKGEPGHRRVEVDSMENTTNIVYERPPKPGNTLYLSLDIDLQQVTERALKKALQGISTGGVYTSPWGDYPFNKHKDGRPYYHAQSGAAIAVNVKTGEVLAMASYPDFDPNLFAMGITSEDWESLMPEHEDDPLAPRPLFNIATQTAVQPGSIFKMLTGLTALEKGMPPDYTIEDMGYVRFRDTQFNCWAWELDGSTHGAENIYNALRDSCNYYFYSLMLGENQRLGTKIPVKVEIEDLVEMAKKFGLNERTGIEINIPTEVSGGVPEPDKKLKRTQEMMRQDLTNRIATFYEDSYGGDELRLEEIVDEIISWTNLEEPLARNEVTARLEKLGLNGEVRPEGNRQGLTDYIKYSYLNHAAWHMGDSLNVAIGQGQNEYSLAQMANYIAILANGGYRNKLSVVHGIRSYDNSRVVDFEKEKGKQIELKDYKNLDNIKQGMLDVSDEGTGARAFANFPVKVGTKTGTAERGGINPSTGMEYDNFAWMVGFAPYDDPEIAVATILVQGGSGGHGGPIIRDMIAQYMGLNQSAQEETTPLEKQFER